MMSHILKYVVVRGTSTTEISEAVQAKLDKGWWLHGELVMTSHLRTIVYAQAMTIRKDLEDVG